MIYKAFGDTVKVIEHGDLMVLVEFPDGIKNWIPLDELEVYPEAKLKNSKPKPRKAIKKVNRKRRSKAFVKHFKSPERVEMIQNTPCEVCWRLPSENAHVVSRGAGGTWREIVPLCREHHAEQHKVGIKAFETKYQVNLLELAKKYH